MLHRADTSGGQTTARAVGAAICAGVLALGASLYPLPGGSQLLDLFPAEEGDPDSLATAPTEPVAFRVADNEILDETGEFELASALLPLVHYDIGILAEIAALPPSALRELVRTYGLPNLALALDALIHGYPSGGWVGEWAAPQPNPATGLLPGLLMVLDFLCPVVRAVAPAPPPAPAEPVVTPVVREASPAPAPDPEFDPLPVAVQSFTVLTAPADPPALEPVVSPPPTPSAEPVAAPTSEAAPPTEEENSEAVEEFGELPDLVTSTSEPGTEEPEDPGPAEKTPDPEPQQDTTHDDDSGGDTGDGPQT
ncbi:hypothetical protein NIIDNTM18_32660 [Mycolicibacterium litorale]|uniref:Uncharacterized protein n=1 Tax=Mycolicibacterium litorale TaxID=758802 RepID=A0A6S6PCU9_9MYCO|nr:hypothetical protein [Mycolicibacterium litorale]BCI53988.1 hypothetical protein NIIDNTM18_32660 [Mycolicibacterium litorale]